MARVGLKLVWNCQFVGVSVSLSQKSTICHAKWHFFTNSFLVSRSVLQFFSCLEAKQRQQNSNLPTRTATPIYPLRQSSSVSLGGAPTHPFVSGPTEHPDLKLWRFEWTKAMCCISSHFILNLETKRQIGFIIKHIKLKQEIKNTDETSHGLGSQKDSLSLQPSFTFWLKRDRCVGGYIGPPVGQRILKEFEITKDRLAGEPLLIFLLNQTLNAKT